MTQTQLAFVILIILVALVFDYVNGWHDAANSIATVVSTRVLSPGLAVIWAAFFNFVAFAIFGTRVAKTSPPSLTFAASWFNMAKDFSSFGTRPNMIPPEPRKSRSITSFVTLR